MDSRPSAKSTHCTICEYSVKPAVAGNRRYAKTPAATMLMVNTTTAISAAQRLAKRFVLRHPRTIHIGILGKSLSCLASYY
jgi:hypothetical protein